jgi:curli biogenesis system outer membrane secretion channel CsgG
VIKSYGTIVLILSFLLSSICFAAPSPEKKIGVLEFENRSAIPNAGLIVSDNMIKDITSLKSCTVVDRTLLSQALEKHGLKFSGFLNPQDISTVSTSLGVDYVLMGSISFVNETKGSWYTDQKTGTRHYTPGSITLSLTLRLVDTQRNQVVWSDTVVKSGPENEKGALELMAYEGVRKFYPMIPIHGREESLMGINILSI